MLNVPTANGKVITTVAGGAEQDINIAVEAARNVCSHPPLSPTFSIYLIRQQAYKNSWGLKAPGSERGRLMYKLADLLEKHRDELGALESLNVGA